MKDRLLGAANRLLSLILRIEVTLLMKSGERVIYTCTNVRVSKSYDNQITKITNDGSSGWPLYVRLDDIAAVLTRKVLL